MPLAYSVIVPVHNEALALPALLKSLARVMTALARPYELIVVDDGSTDDSPRALERAATEIPALRLVSLGRRMGKSAALQAGFDASRGEIIVTLDGDGQNDPRDIPRLLAKLEEGYDLVCGWRHRRKDPLSKKWASWLGNAVRALTTRDGVHDVGCALRALRRPVIDKIYLTGGLHRMFVALAARFGFRVAEIKVRHHPRRFGASKYGFWDRLLESAGNLPGVLRLDASRPMRRTGGKGGWTLPGKLMLLVAGLFVAAGLWVRDDYGPNIDSRKNWSEAEANLTYLATGRVDMHAAINQLHGSLVFMASELSRMVLSDSLGLLEPVAARHIVLIPFNAVFALLLFGFVRRHRDGWTALAAAACFLTVPEYVGYAFSDIKDVPLVVFFSLAVMAAFEWKTKRRRRYFYAFYLFWGLALSVKLYALMVAPVLLAAAGWQRLAFPGLPPRGRPAGWRRHLGGLALAACLVLAFYAPGWWGVADKAALAKGWLARASAISLSPDTGFRLLPFQQLFYRTPVLTLVCAAAGAVSLLRRAKSEAFAATLIAWFFLPMLLACAPGFYLYFQGLRLVLVVYVPFAIMASQGAFSLAGALGRGLPATRRGACAAAFVLAMLAGNLGGIAASHPYETLFFNRLAGGLGGAQKKRIPVSCDYWLNSYREAGRWLDVHAQPGAEIREVFDARIPPRYKGVLGYSVKRPDLRIVYQDSRRFNTAPIPRGAYIVFVPYSWYWWRHGQLERDVAEGRLEKSLEISRLGGLVATVYHALADIPAPPPRR